ncbi:heme exporter protein CcmD [Saccharospirillum alexandrii]|uniref:heme exporter protein CcmD n=1 Tax=Saccharospirillum alexandrii TaxID=2448477 RepID=UPI0037351077
MGAFDSFSAFLAMGDHGAYVWSAYAVGAAVIAFNVIAPRVHRQRLISDHKRRVRREQR